MVLHLPSVPAILLVNRPILNTIRTVVGAVSARLRGLPSEVVVLSSIAVEYINVQWKWQTVLAVLSAWIQNRLRIHRIAWMVYSAKIDLPHWWSIWLIKTVNVLRLTNFHITAHVFSTNAIPPQQTRV